MSNLDALEAKLQHSFRDRALLKEALTHASADAACSNERLEFLGDRVLGLVVAQALLNRYRAAPEGELALRLNALVRKETCAEMAQKAGIADHIILSAGERVTGRSRNTVLADCCEAVIAALFLDGGLVAAERFIMTHWGERMEWDLTTTLEPKSELQIWVQAQGGGALPVYKVLQSSGPAHAPHFVVEVSVPGAGEARGEGKSKREAERNAAAIMLARVKTS